MPETNITRNNYFLKGLDYRVSGAVIKAFLFMMYNNEYSVIVWS